ncbi:MAG: hypothetical protein QOJ25_3397 [Solirubrobacteraceae bacterium]|jgi:uncharacterized membrane protein YbhN (UPF0104 family)|nr:hypothetical protein [Solirubrobacteraceae bacterium]
MSAKPASLHQLLGHLITLVVLVVLAAGLLAAVPGLHGVERLLTHVSPGWVALAVAFELCSCLGYVLAFEQVFPAVPRRTASLVAWSELGFQTVFPAGGAGGSALGGWMLHEKGAPWGRIAERSAVLFMLTSAISVLAAVVFGFLLAVGVLAGPHHLLLGAVPAAAGTAVLLLAIASPRLVRSSIAKREWKHGRLKAVFEGLAQSVVDTERFLLGRDWKLVGTVGYLAFDIMVLWVGFLAFGHPPGAATIVLGYLVGSMANAIPIPGGIGALDGGLVGALVLYGAGATTATAAVLIYHAIWLLVPLVIGAVAFLLERPHLEEPLPEARQSHPPPPRDLCSPP